LRKTGSGKVKAFLEREVKKAKKTLTQGRRFC